MYLTKGIEMNPDEELYPGNNDESDMTDQDTTETDMSAFQTNEDTFGEQITPDAVETEEISDSDQIGAETAPEQLRDEQTY